MFEPSRIGTLSLVNRFIRSATWEGMADDNGQCTRRLVHLMSELAMGGAGLIITGHAYVHQNGRHSPWQLGIDRDELLPGLQKMTGAVHDSGGKIAVQLGYGGAYLSRSRLRSLSGKELHEIVAAFSHAAERAKAAGFDAVQIFAAHGFLLSQFLCPRYNDRADLYGGNIQNRARILLDILDAVRQAVGPDYPVLAKLNGRDFVDNGLRLEEAVEVGMMLEERGLDAIELSGGLLNNPNALREKIESEKNEAYFRNEARAFKEKVRIPLILVGGIRSYTIARQLVEEGAADYISMSRPFICEPDLVKRWQAGDLAKSACISCNNCVEEVKAGHGLKCIPHKEPEQETFFLQLSETVKANPPQPPGTSYRVAVGLESINGQFAPVVKIEMERNGTVLDQPPCFPMESDDLERVIQCVTRLLKEVGREFIL